MHQRAGLVPLPTSGPAADDAAPRSAELGDAGLDLADVGFSVLVHDHHMCSEFGGTPLHGRARNYLPTRVRSNAGWKACWSSSIRKMVLKSAVSRVMSSRVMLMKADRLLPDLIARHGHRWVVCEFLGMLATVHVPRQRTKHL